MNNKTVLIIFFISFLFRLPIIFFYGDNSLQDEWDDLLKNLITYNTLATLRFDNVLVPNLYMPPLYAYFLYLISLFFNDLGVNYIISVLIIQSILASFTIIIFFKILKNFYSDKVSILGSLIFSLYPLNLYSVGQISSITLTLFLSIAFYFVFIKLIKTNNNKLLIILFSLLSGLLILTRREFIIFFLITNFFLFFFIKLKIKKIIIICFLTTLVISPYLIRNYIAFDRIIIQAGFGFNLWKAYNPNSKVEGSYYPSKDLQNKLNNIPRNKFYRINENKIFLDQAINYIKDEPYKYLKIYFLRMFSYYFSDFTSSQKLNYNFLHLVPNILISVLFSISLFFYNKKSILLNYFLLIFIAYILLFSFFAILPRYKLYIIPFQIIFSLQILKRFSWYK